MERQITNKEQEILKNVAGNSKKLLGKLGKYGILISTLALVFLMGAGRMERQITNKEQEILKNVIKEELDFITYVDVDTGICHVIVTNPSKRSWISLPMWMSIQASAM